MRRIMRSFAIAATAALASAATAPAEATSTLSPWVQGFVKARAPDVALTHMGVIDGMGALAREHQTLIISDGKITAVGDASSIAVPMQAKVVDLNGKTTIPGLVGMHEHVFYSNGWASLRRCRLAFRCFIWPVVSLRVGRPEPLNLKAAADAAHRHGTTMTGHARSAFVKLRRLASTISSTASSSTPNSTPRRNL